LWKVILATLAIFGAGVVGGRLWSKHAPGATPSPAPVMSAQYNNPWQMRNRDLLRRMDRELALTPEQHERIEKIMGTSQDRTRNLWSPIAQEMNKETVHVCDEIRDVLTPEQRAKFDVLSKPHPGNGAPRGMGGAGERGRRRGATNFPGIDSTNRSITNFPIQNQDGG
jgi:Spy/CpxP family protein refolding chaperone